MRFRRDVTQLLKVVINQKFAVSLLLVMAAFDCFAGNVAVNDVEEKPLRFVPLVTSTPLAGTGLGGAASYLYKIGEGSSTSQLEAGAQYSNTDSITTFIRNTAFYKSNQRISITKLLWSDINSEFDGSDDERVKYKIKSTALTQKLLFQTRDKLYLGGQLIYKDLEYSPNNQAGADFLFDNGIVDEESLGGSVSGAYDSRENKYYPSDATWVDIDAAVFPSALGAIDTYYKLTLNARLYKRGLAQGDVWASQLYGEYATEKTPDSGLPTLSGKALLRGFPAGQFRAMSLTGMQTEYRYQIVNKPYRLIAFGGVARLAGGSYGQGDQARDDDGTYWAVGIGGRYAIQSKTGVDLRLDFVFTSESESSVYLALNQAF
jgi:hypothetical protein